MCKYKIRYWDYEARKFLLFECTKKAVKDGFCIFHHPNCWKEYPVKVANEFYKKVESAIQNNEKLLCIGFNLPELTLRMKFEKPVYFNSSGFHGKTDFQGAAFNRACFQRATFNKAFFRGATFKQELDFNKSTFNAAYFSKATFGRANFCNTIFGKAVFKEAIFNEAYFANATFNEAYFTGAKFNEKADFRRARFNIADFIYATFGKADFVSTEFNEEVCFNNATFSQAYFFALRRKRENSIYGNDPILKFKSVDFCNPEEAHFDYFDLSNTSFAYTDVSRVDIGERIQWKTNEKMYDERLADEGKLPYGKVATVYRRLRQNLESKMRYTEAGRFFTGEMECKRKDVENKNHVLKWLRTNVFSTLAWYKYFSNYGESYQRLIPWIIGTPFLAAFLTTLLQTSLSSLAQFTTDFQQNLRNYIFAFFQLKTDNTIELAIRILSLLLMGQLYIALRRQFERKYKTTSQ